LASPSSLVLITSKVPSGNATLLRHQVRSSARLLSKVGGTRIGLHARVALNVLRTSTLVGFDAAALHEHYRELEARCSPPQIFERRKMTDEEVQRFIRESGVSTYSAALRRLRDGGYACEQKRFRHLFESVEAQL
jgi:hypothetical protein